MLRVIRTFLKRALLEAIYRICGWTKDPAKHRDRRDLYQVKCKVERKKSGNII